MERRLLSLYGERENVSRLFPCFSTQRFSRRSRPSLHRLGLAVGSKTGGFGRGKGKEREEKGARNESERAPNRVPGEPCREPTAARRWPDAGREAKQSQADHWARMGAKLAECKIRASFRVDMGCFGLAMGGRVRG